MIQEQLGEGRCQVTGWLIPCGSDAAVTILGGTHPHVGAVSLGLYESERDSATVSTLTVFSHRDDVCAAPCAKLAARILKANVTVSVGIHIDNPKPEELKTLSDNALLCCERLVRSMISQKDNRR